MLLDLHSLTSEERTQQPAWVPRPRRRTEPQRQVVVLGMDAELPQLDGHGHTTVRTRVSTYSTLLAAAARAALDADNHGGWTDEVLLLAAAALFLLDDDDD
jgi:hypothetical protein